MARTGEVGGEGGGGGWGVGGGVAEHTTVIFVLQPQVHRPPTNRTLEQSITPPLHTDTMATRKRVFHWCEVGGRASSGAKWGRYGEGDTAQCKEPLMRIQSTHMFFACDVW